MNRFASLLVLVVFFGAGFRPMLPNQRRRPIVSTHSQRFIRSFRMLRPNSHRWQFLTSNPTGRPRTYQECSSPSSKAW